MSAEIKPGQNIVRQFEFPSDLEGRMEAVLSSFNIPTKAVTDLLLTESMIDPDSLSRLFKQVMYGSDMSEVDQRAAPGYCHQTLCPIGLIAEEVSFDSFGKEEIVGYQSTLAGIIYGHTSAVHFLDFEAEHNFSSYPILGQTRISSGCQHRAPYTRSIILKLLNSKENGIRQVDICNELELAQTLSRNSLLELAKAGVVEYQHITPRTGKEKVTYTLGDLPVSEIKPVGGKRTLTEAVVQISQELVDQGKEISQSDVYDKIPDSIKNKWNKEHLRDDVRKILSGFATQGFLQRGMYKGGETLSYAQITNKGRLVVEKLINPLEDALSDGEYLTILQEQTLPKVLGNLAEYAKKTANLYYPYSQSYKVKEYHDNKDKALVYLNNSTDSNGLLAEDLAAKLGLNKITGRRYLNSLVKNGLAKREDRNGVYYYFPVKLPSLPTPGVG